MTRRLPTKTMAMINERFGMLTVVSGNGQFVGCVCDCGAIRNLNSYCVRSGHSKSCGCARASHAAKRFTTHGQSYTNEYKQWRCMIDRCHLKTHSAYKWYGAIGISVCDRWRNKLDGFANFKADMGRKPSPSHSIDRYPNRKGNYEPGNCRWATKREQSLNTSTTTFLTHKSVTKSLSEWADEFYLPDYVIRKRIKAGWDVARAIETPKAPRRQRSQS